jgi:hypothetical protein
MEIVLVTLVIKVFKLRGLLQSSILDLYELSTRLSNNHLELGFKLTDIQQPLSGI